MNDTLSEINGINNNNYQTNNFQNYNTLTSREYPELGSPPVGPFVSPISPQELLNNKMYTTMTCYNCLSVLLVRKDWIFTRCGECQKINRIPRERITENYYKYSYYQEDNDLVGDIPYVYGLVVCPFCTMENKIRKEAKRVTCYNCANSFTVNGFYNDRINKINNYNKKYPNTFIKYNNYIPIYPPCDCNCKQNTQILLLDKILENIKDIKKPQIAYPLLFNDPYGFHYRDLLRDNHNKRYNENSYINNNQLVKSMNFQIKNKENESNGFRITIRKKNNNKNNIGNKMTKSAVFEKVFFTNKLNNDNKISKFE